MRHLLAVTVAIFLAAPAIAQTPACAISYQVFEFAVPHIDLEECPADMEGEARFCRAAVGTDMLHVFAFQEEGEQCLIEARSYEEDDFEVSFQ